MSFNARPSMHPSPWILLDQRAELDSEPLHDRQLEFFPNAPLMVQRQGQGAHHGGERVGDLGPYPLQLHRRLCPLGLVGRLLQLNLPLIFVCRRALGANCAAEWNVENAREELDRRQAPRGRSRGPEYLYFWLCGRQVSAA